MVPGRLLLLINDRSLQAEIERGLNKRTAIVVPSHVHSIEECIHDGRYYSVVLSYEFANRYQSELLSMSERTTVPVERLLVYKESEWANVAPLVENGVVTRLIPHFWDVQTIVDLLIRLCEREEIEHALNRHHTQGLAEGSEADLRKRIFELEMQNRRLSALATTDALTGLANRRELNDVLSREIARSKRFGYPLSFVMCDVDFFKNYNDLFGHPAGDEVLQTIASLMRSRLRGSDIAARYGGEEFGLILPQTTKEQALRVADSLRKRIEEHPFPNEEKQPSGNLTISMGVAGLGEDGDTATLLVDRADRALYRAKQTGRNRVVAFDKQEPDWPAKEVTPIES